MKNEINRRNFVKSSLIAGIGLSAIPQPFNILKSSPAKKVVVAVMGVRSRGNALAKVFASLKDCEVAYLCEVDNSYVENALKTVGEYQKSKPKVEKDIRKVLEDKDVDALVIAAPDHWHAPAGIMACQAGKHVYVEKPSCHNPQEGEWLVAASRKYNRLVQMGNQRRTWIQTKKCIDEIHAGIIGRVYYARGWYANGREPIGFGKEVAVPDHLDFDLWQGPAPRRPYKDNIHPYNWHWFWHWGTGEALNNGTHFVDLMRWGLEVDYPTRVSSSGGRYHYRDDWETPDTHIVNYDFEDGKTMVWESRSCNRQSEFGSSTGVAFYGEKGTAVIHGLDTYYIYENTREQKLIKEVTQSGASEIDTVGPGMYFDAPHAENFLAAIRDGVQLNSEIEEGNKSTLYCHLGNIAWRTGRTLNIDQRNGRIVGDAEAMKLWGREYAPGWRPQV